MHDLISKILGSPDIAPDAPGPGGRPAAYTVVEWQANECATLDEAKVCRDYLAGWPEGPQGGMLTAVRVAAILDLTRQAVWQQIKRGHIHAVRIGDMLLVPMGELERWKPVKAGRPRADGKADLPAMTGTGTARQEPPHRVDENLTQKNSSQKENN